MRMLTKCPECELPVSTNAITCPHCGNPLKRISKNPHREKSRMRLPNGFGQISEIKGRNLRNPYRVMVTVSKSSTGKPICKPLKPQAYFKTYNEAYAALVEYNKNPYDLSDDLRMSELYTRWTDEYFLKIANSSQRTITSAWAYCKSIYDMRVKDIRGRHIKGCLDSVESPNTKSRIKSLFNLMLDYAVEYELVDKNYARTFNLSDDVTKEIETARKPHKSFTDDELKLLWNNINVPFVRDILIQTYMGWRPQELVSIKIENINLTDWTITGGMKTDSGTDRVVPIHPDIKELVMYKIKEAKKYTSEFLCYDLDGSSLTYDKYNKRFSKLMEALNIEDHRPHDPRKTFVTLAKKYELDEYAIKRIVGHAIDDITEKLYTDRNINWLSDEIKKIEIN